MFEPDPKNDVVPNSIEHIKNDSQNLPELEHESPSRASRD